ncbi:MAG: hypothetical protein LBT97_08375 [Planctomycetota bacterium]|nr:hypothetical protein [Planctomycetota bacterium]
MLTYQRVKSRQFAIRVSLTPSGQSLDTPGLKQNQDVGDGIGVYAKFKPLPVYAVVELPDGVVVRHIVFEGKQDLENNCFAACGDTSLQERASECFRDLIPYLEIATRSSSPEAKITLFRSLFSRRMDVYPRRYETFR